MQSVTAVATRRQGLRQLNKMWVNVLANLCEQRSSWALIMGCLAVHSGLAIHFTHTRTSHAVVVDFSGQPLRIRDFFHFSHLGNPLGRRFAQLHKPHTFVISKYQIPNTNVSFGLPAVVAETDAAGCGEYQQQQQQQQDNNKTKRRQKKTHATKSVADSFLYWAQWVNVPLIKWA